MSLKDDFLEALRSVKRDFFKDYDYTDPSSNNIPQQNASAQPELMDELPPPPARDFEAQPPQVPPVSQTGFDQMAKSATEDAEALPDSWAADLHSKNIDDEDSLPPDVNTAPMRTASDFAGKIFNDPVAKHRMIFDDYEDAQSYGDEKTVISKNTIIRGALQTEDSVRMFGQVMGDIDCKSNILVAGKVRGNTSAANAYVIDAQVDGNLLCDDVVNINDDAWILGNIRAQQAEIDGKIKGNIEIRHSVSIGSNSSVIGNISTDELEIKRGAFINGQIMMYSPSRDVIDRFDQFDR